MYCSTLLRLSCTLALCFPLIQCVASAAASLAFVAGYEVVEAGIEPVVYFHCTLGKNASRSVAGCKLCDVGKLSSITPILLKGCSLHSFYD